jgi:hypothetical protein
MKNRFLRDLDSDSDDTHTDDTPGTYLNLVCDTVLTGGYPDATYGPGIVPEPLIDSTLIP